MAMFWLRLYLYLIILGLLALLQLLVAAGWAAIRKVWRPYLTSLPQHYICW